MVHYTTHTSFIVLFLTSSYNSHIHTICKKKMMMAWVWQKLPYRVDNMLFVLLYYMLLWYKRTKRFPNKFLFLLLTILKYYLYYTYIYIHYIRYDTHHHFITNYIDARKSKAYTFIL